MKFNYKKCIACGCLTAIIVTDWGVFCKECFYTIHKHPDLPNTSFGNFLLDDYNKSGIETTVTAVSRTATDLSDFYGL